jgi:hypothetical protein
MGRVFLVLSQYQSGPAMFPSKACRADTKQTAACPAPNTFQSAISLKFEAVSNCLDESNQWYIKNTISDRD